MRVFLPYLFAVFSGLIYAQHEGLELDKETREGVSQKSEEKNLLLPENREEEKGETLSSQDAFSFVYRSRNSTVCRVRTLAHSDRVQVGSGLFVSERGHLLTTASTVKGGEIFRIEFQRKLYEAHLVGYDETTNVALLKTDTLPDKAGYVILSETKPLPEITTIVFSLSYKLEFEVTPGMGYVEGHDVSYFDRLWPSTFLRTNLRMDGGDGGGSVFDSQGNLVGMLTFSLKDIRQGSYVIPVRVLAKVCNDLLLFGKVRYGYVGIETETMLDKSTGDLYQGVLKVHPHSPAEKAGIREGDVLNTLDGKNIRTREELVNGAFFTSPGQRVAVEYLRNGNPSKIYLEVGSRPDNGEK